MIDTTVLKSMALETEHDETTAQDKALVKEPMSRSYKPGRKKKTDHRLDTRDEMKTISTQATAKMTKDEVEMITTRATARVTKDMVGIMATRTAAKMRGLGDMPTFDACPGGASQAGYNRNGPTNRAPVSPISKPAPAQMAGTSLLLLHLVNPN